METLRERRDHCVIENKDCERKRGRERDRETERENRANYSPYSTLNLWVADSKATNVIIKSISWAQI